MNEASKYIDQWVRADGYTNGRTDGYTDGRTVGFNDGRARERANSLLDVLAARSLNVPLAIRERITSCADIDTLQRWFTLALTTTNIDAFVQGMD
jgi:hypothetical protein